MNNIEVQIVFNNLPNVAPSVRREVENLIRTTALQVVEEAKQLIYDLGKSGRIYIIGGIVHQASAPGEAPANLSGELANSICANFIDELMATVSVSAEYASTLEYGSLKIGPRPFLQPAVDKVEPNFKEGIADAIRRGCMVAVSGYTTARGRTVAPYTRRRPSRV